MPKFEGRELRVMDTNVAKFADGWEARPTPCGHACMEFLSEHMANGASLTDEGLEMIEELARHFDRRGRPNPGDQYLRWLLDNLGTPLHPQISLTPTLDAQNRPSFKEFPADSDLEKFDRSDRKFVAAALAHPLRPPVAYASDRGWARFRAPLQRIGLSVVELCAVRDRTTKAATAGESSAVAGRRKKSV